MADRSGDGQGGRRGRPALLLLTAALIFAAGFGAGSFSGVDIRSSSDGSAADTGLRNGRDVDPAMLTADVTGWVRSPTVIPGEVVWITPGMEPQRVVEEHPAGTTFAFSTGVHSGVKIIPRDGDVFLGQDGAILDGSVLLPADEFVRDVDTGLWVIPSPESKVRHDPVDCAPEADHHYKADRGILCLPEDLHGDNNFLRREPDPSEVDRPGEWSLHDGQIWLFQDPSSYEELRLSIADHAFEAKYRADVADVHIEGLEIRRYAPRPQEGAIEGTWGVDWTILNVHVHRNHAHGIQMSDGGLVAGSLVDHNGQMGLGVRGVTVDALPGPLLIAGNEIAHNNRLGFRSAWEAGAMKVLTAADVEVSGNWVHDNNGHGIWFDTNNDDVRILGNLVEDNADTGILYETSFGPAVISDNLVQRQGDKGIWVSDSSGVSVTNNVVIDAAHGSIMVTDDGRENGRHRGLDVIVRGNDLTHLSGDLESGWRRAPQLPDELDPASIAVEFSGNTWRTDVNESQPVAHFGKEVEVYERTWEQWQGLGMDNDGRLLELTPSATRLPDGSPLPLQP